ncbi:hypothetical protein IAU60_001993 [Kwoniella sp. DSM 27419]
MPAAKVAEAAQGAGSEPAPRRRTTRATAAANAAKATATSTTSRSKAKAGEDDLVEGLGKLSIQAKPKATRVAKTTSSAAAEPAQTTTNAVASSSRAVRTAAKPSASRTATTAKGGIASSSKQDVQTTISNATTDGKRKERVVAPSRPRKAPATTQVSSTIPNGQEHVVASSSARKVQSSATVPSAKGKQKERVISPLERSLPWANVPLEPTPDQPALKPIDRAKAATAALNGALRELTAAIQAGVRHSSIPPHTIPPAHRPQQGEGFENWTDEKIEQLEETYIIALRVLRELAQTGHIANKQVDLERSAQNLVNKYLGLGMYKRSLETLSAFRPHLLALYTPQSATSSAAQLSSETIQARVAATNPRKVTSGGHSPHMGTSATVRSPTAQWQEITRLPLPAEADKLSEDIRLVLFSSVMSAWISLVVISGDPSELVPILTLPGQAKPGMVDILSLGLTLPRTSIRMYGHTLYRQITLLSLSMATQTSFQLFIRGLYSLALTVTSTPDSKATPAQYWDTVHRFILSYIKHDNQEARLREAASAAESIVDWTQKIVRQNSERDWFEGSSWLGFVEMWVGMGRRLGDSTIIDKTLSLLAKPASISSPTPVTPPAEVSAKVVLPAAIPSTPPAQNKTLIQTPVRSQAAPLPSSRPAKQFKDPGLEIARITADLAKASLALEKAASSKASTPVVSIPGLVRQDLITLAEAVAASSHQPDILSIAGKAVRAWERVRRGSCKALGDTDKPGREAFWAKVNSDIVGWLTDSLEFVEILVESQILDITLTRDAMSGSIDNFYSLYRTDHVAAYQPAMKVYKLMNFASPQVEDADRLDWLRCLSSLAYNGAAITYKQSKWQESTEMVQSSCDWGDEGIRLYRGRANLSSNEAKNVATIQDFLYKRWELLASCFWKQVKKEATYTAYARSLASQPPSTLTKLASASSSSPIETALAPLMDLTNVLARLGLMVNWDPAQYPGHGPETLRLMQEAGVPQAAVGAVGEKLLSMFAEVAWKEEGARCCLEISDCLLEIYGETFPVRRLRVLVGQLRTIAASGRAVDRFPSVIQDIQRISEMTDLGEDSALGCYKAEYVANSLVLQALYTYHTDKSPSSAVINCARNAVQALRSIILPPTASLVAPVARDPENRKKMPLGRSTTTKAVPPHPRGGSRVVSEPNAALKKLSAVTPGSKATPAGGTKPRRSSIASTLSFDDLRELARNIGSLASLLEVLGHTMQQIEMIKLLRAFLRNRDDMVNEYVLRSAHLATEYQKLGKISRAGFVFQQARRVVEHGRVLVSSHAKVFLLLRHTCYLAAKGNVSEALDNYTEAYSLEKGIEALKNGSYQARVVDRSESLERAAWARKAAAYLCAAQDDASNAIAHLTAVFRIYSRASDAVCRLASVHPASTETDKVVAPDDPFGAPPPKSEPKPSGADEPSKDSKTPLPSQVTHYTGKHLSSIQWQTASSLINSLIDVSAAFAYRGSVRDAEYFLKLAGSVAEAVKSDVLVARIGAKEAELLFRMRKWDETGTKLESAAEALSQVEEGLDMIDLNRLKGDLYSKTEMIEEAGEVFESTSKEIAGLDAVFIAAEAVMPSPRKNAFLATSTSSVRASLTPNKGPGGKEPLLPATLAHVLRQHAWLLREAGSKEECEALLLQIRSLPMSTESKAEELLLEGRIALHEAFNTFKTDLFMSSLTESAVAMPMGNPSKRPADRQSTRLGIQAVLARAEESFLSALSLASGSGKIEGIRQACLALALLRTFQTSLGQGSSKVTAAAADILASSSSITLHRELLEIIDNKFSDVTQTDLTWPVRSQGRLTVAKVSSTASTADAGTGADADNLDDTDGRLRSYWDLIKAKYQANQLGGPETPRLDALPPEWVVISINVTDDHNTMFISRHQRECDPIVFCLPLDRQGRREGEDDLWTFDAAVAEFDDIINCSNATTRNAKNVDTKEGRIAWWEERHRLDKKMKELCESLEFVWLGAFKTILANRSSSIASSAALADFRERLERIFDLALSSTSGGATKPRNKDASAQVLLEGPLLECFARLSSKAKDEEIEDLVYFILDVYQFHGIPVALSELDIDQIAIDVRGALEKVEGRLRASVPSSRNEHLFLALDKNVQCFPWESIPILRGRAVSRIPSLSFLVDQVAMGAHLRPSLAKTLKTGSIGLNGEVEEMKRMVNSRRTFYILNPSGDLTRTQEFFQPWIDEMIAKGGWKGIIGRAPTELEMAAALKDYDLVLYFGHGGAEQYIRSHRIRHLPQCATTMLWGCSSGHLKDQGDFDRTGTAWNYMLGGCPSLTANLWDVTDRDIDRLSFAVLKSLQLDAAHVPDDKARSNTLLPLSELSTVQAVNQARDECRLTYLTGAAPVTYGLPVYLH